MLGLNILVVDDDIGDRKLLRRCLSGSGLEPTLMEAETSDAAYAYCDQALDAIFLDYHLPKVTGLSVLSNFRKAWPGAAIFLMTGQGDEDVAKSAILEGASDYLSKAHIDEARIKNILKNGVTTARMRRRLEVQHDDLATFSEVLVHDFRAPIRATAFLTEQIEEDLRAGRTSEALHGLTVLNKSALQMGEILTSLSDHIRFDRDEAFEAARPEELLELALQVQEIEIVETRAKVDKHLATSLPKIHCQPPQVIQVLQNLIANALKYSGDATPEISISIEREACGMVIFRISDKGIGIPEEFEERVFEPFKRVPGTGDTKGTGLGLATCKKVVQRHGGQIWCQPKLAIGTSIAFTIPVSDGLANKHSTHFSAVEVESSPAA